MNPESKKTELYKWHTAHKAKMADFGGYEMPLWYESAKNEHICVITKAGIFDTSHMAAVIVKGKNSKALIQHTFTNNLEACVGKNKKPLHPGRCVYGAFLNQKGHVIDDAIVFMMEKERYMVVVNAGMGGKIASWLSENSHGKDAVITNLTDMLGKMDIQGPLSVKIMEKILENHQKVFEKMPYFSFKGNFEKNSLGPDEVKIRGEIPILLSRTGYTGELGFEIFVDPAHLIKTWEIILDAGEEFGLIPCGLAARDSLRAGAVLPLSHQDIGPWPFINNPWPFALPFNDDKSGFTKSFIGDKALIEAKGKPPFTYAFVGDDLRKVSLPAEVWDSRDQKMGQVLTCVTEMALGKINGKIFSIKSKDKPENFRPKGLSCGFVKVTKKLEPGDVIFLKDKRRKIKANIAQDIRPGRTARISIKI